MDVIKQTFDQLIIKHGLSQKNMKIYAALLFVCFIFIAIVATVDHLPLPLSIVISIILTATFFMIIWHTYTYLIDKSEDYIRALKDNRLVYESDYPLSQIKSIKTRIGKKYGRNSTVQLIVLLKNDEEQVINTFYIDDFATKQQTEVGKKIAEFLEVPFIEGEYHPPFI